MAAKPAAQIVPFETLLKGRAPQVRRWARALRRIVKSAVPRAAERSYKGWNVLVFAPTKEMKMKEMFCGISPHKDTVGLYFHHGVKLPDPHKILEGAGKGMRQVKIRSDKDLRPTPPPITAPPSSWHCHPEFRPHTSGRGEGSAFLLPGEQSQAADKNVCATPRKEAVGQTFLSA